VKDNSNKNISNNPNIIYERALRSDPEYLKMAEKLWGEIIPDLSSLKSRFKKGLIHKRKHETIKDLEVLKKSLIEYHEKLGILTDKTIENIEKIVNGSILSGHQPIIFGGPGLISNKIATLQYIQSFLEKHNVKLAPIFMIADYDGLHKELVRMYFTTPRSSKPQILDISKNLDYPEQTAFHRIKSPSVKWLIDTIRSVKLVNREFSSKLSNEQKALFLENLDHILNMLMISYTSTSTLKDWFVKFWGTITNLINDWGIIYFPVKDKKISQVLTKYYAPFLLKNEDYVSSFNEKYYFLKRKGFKPTLKTRDKQIAQFFVECPNDGVRMHPLISGIDHETYIIKTKCPHCKNEYIFKFENGNFDKKISLLLNPKVDSSSGIVQELLNTQIRISGPGEIAYFAMVRSGILATGIRTPIYIKYKRVFYNTPWIEQLGKFLNEKGIPSLHSQEFFKLLSKLAKVKRKRQFEQIPIIEQEVSDYIKHIYNKLLEYSGDPDVDTYLSWQFGRFSKQKFGQEVSWVWFELGKVTGLNYYFNAFNRVFSENYSFGGMYYLGTTLKI